VFVRPVHACLSVPLTVSVGVRRGAVLDGRPDNPPVDLRLDRPLPAVMALARAADLAAMDSHQLSHTPFVLLLLRFLEAWRSEHDGAVPATRADKDAFKQRVRTSPYHQGQRNFDEAVANAHRVWSSATVRTRTPPHPKRTRDGSVRHAGHCGCCLCGC
jgi:hypothetical protein